MASFIIAILSSNNCTSQTDTNQNERMGLKTFGIGINLNSEIFNDFYSFYENPDLLIITLNISDAIRLEPSFGFYLSSEEKNGSKIKEKSSFSTGIGLYGLKSKKSFAFKFGLKYYYLYRKNDKDIINNNIDRYKVISNGIGPSVGIEFVASKHFSIGTEFGLYYLIENETYDQNFGDSIIESESQFKVYRSNIALQLRFYF